MTTTYMHPTQCRRCRGTFPTLRLSFRRGVAYCESCNALMERIERILSGLENLADAYRAVGHSLQSAQALSLADLLHDLSADATMTLTVTTEGSDNA